MNRMEMLDKVLEILYVCPICKACRSTQEINLEPCRLCGHELMPYFEWQGREILRSAAEEAPTSPGRLREAFQCQI